MNSRKRISIIDVAKKAGVSIATVSRVINQNGGYSKETEQKVRQTIEECGFTPNVNAIGLRTNRSNSIGVIVPDITNEFFAKIVRELDIFLLGRRYSLLICNSNEDYALENMHIRGLAEKHVDGIIYISGQNEIKRINEIKNLPVVYIDRAPKNAEVLILSDNEMGGYLAACELISKGCRRILFLRDIRYASTIRSRKNGYIRGLRDGGLSFSDELEMSCFPEYGEARSVMERLLKEKGCFFDGIFATNDMMALACINVLTENGIRVPGAIKVVGFDNVSITQFTSPQITTIGQDTRALALRAGETILKMIAGEEVPEKKTIIPVHLIVRKTT
ncbi:LacI family DNA-binding transcriptional regulator [Lachnospiraceae bacterium 54-53]